MKQKLLLFFLLCICLSSQVFSQSKTVSGKVTDPNTGEGIPGVSIFIKGTTSGTVTDANGSYSIDASEGAVLIFQAIGLEQQEITVGAQSVIDARLSPSTRALEEVVIVGLATSVKRSNLANAVSTISSNELTGSTRAVTLDAAMTGKITGAVISQNSGAPGGGLNVLLRGPSSLGGSSQPLYIVDGVYVNNSQFLNGRGAGPFANAGGSNQDDAPNRLSDLNPADIENIEILKGSSAAAIYGTRANAGVVIITTKRGKTGKTKFNFGQDLGFAEAIRFLGSSDWDDAKLAEFYTGARLTQEIAALQDARSKGQIIDYEEEIFGKTAFLRNTRLSVSGGDAKTKFFLSGGITDEEGIMKKTGFERYSIRANIDHKVSKFLDVSLSSGYFNTSAARGYTNNDNNGVAITYNLSYIPNYAQLKPDNGIFPDNIYTPDNPFAIVEKAVNNEQTNRFVQAFTANLYFLQKEKMSLKLAGSGGLDYLLTEAELYMPPDLQHQRIRANPGASRYTKNRSFNTNIQFLLVFNAQAGKFDLTTSAGIVRLTNNFDISHTQGEGLPPGQKNPLNASIQTINQSFQKVQDVGIFAQQEANYDNKVIATVGIRFDKSSLNGDFEKYYAFPRASLAVNVANFDFWTFKDVINVFKPRIAFGQTGGLPSFGDTFTNLGSTAIGGRLGLQSPQTLGNVNVEPETAQEIEFGADFAFLDNRISLDATYYVKDIKDLIQPFQLASGTGYASIAAFPVGDMRNTGLELALTANPVRSENINWTTTVQYWYNRTEITRLDVPITNVGPSFGNTFGRNQLRLNESPTRWFGLPFETASDGTQVLSRYEESQPDFQMSFINSIRFLKNFEFSFLFHWKKGGHNVSLSRLLKDEGGTSEDWSNDDDGDGVVNGIQRQSGTSSRDFIVDASYVRLREVSLYYSLPKALVSNIFKNTIENIRVGISGNNVLTFTDYKGGYDPEVSNFGNRPTGGLVDLASFPNTRRFFFHLSFDF